MTSPLHGEDPGFKSPRAHLPFLSTKTAQESLSLMIIGNYLMSIPILRWTWQNGLRCGLEVLPYLLHLS